MKKIIGCMMIGGLFLGVFITGCVEAGMVKTVSAFGISFLIIAIVSVGVFLIND